MTIEALRKISRDEQLSYDLWDVYAETFKEINTMAMQRHQMFVGEFLDMIEDVRLEKYIVRSDEGELIGFGVLTNILEAWHLISPQYFERRWPDLSVGRRIWYVGFVGVKPSAQGGTAFRDLIIRMSKPSMDAKGLIVIDCCTHNVQRQLPQVTYRLVSHVYPSMGKPELLDAQEFWGYTFS